MAAADRRREAPFGVDTEGTIELDKLAIADEPRSLGFSYVLSPGLLVDTLILSIDEDLSRFSFIDFGSGKGRVLLVAAHYPFREVVGVEFSHELHGIAQINIINYKSSARRCQDIHSVCADAASFTIPEHACVLYFNNPFAEPIFARVLRNVQTAHERGHQKIYLLYQQLSGDLETDRTQNVAMLERAAFLREQQVRFRTGFTRFLLGSYELRIFETANSWRSIRG
jgi:SAM-dependent methyltransferase